jgi:hypothetical protein
MFALVVALASPKAEPLPVERRHELRVDIGLFSAVGYGGLSYTYSPPLPLQLLLEAGVGYGYTGLQLSGMPKLAFGHGRTRYVLGAGLSAGIGGGGLASYWINGELGLAYRDPSGFSFYGEMGPTVGLAGRMPAACVLDCAGFPDSATQPAQGMAGAQMRLGCGYWF